MIGAPHYPSAGPLEGAPSGVAEGPDAANAAIIAQATAAVAAGQPSEWLVSYRTSEQQIADQAQVISAASALPAAQADTAARLQHYRDVKARTGVLQGGAGAASTGAEPLPSVQLLEEFTHLPVAFVSISSADDLARLQAHPDVLNVEPNKLAYPAALSHALQHIGQPAVQAQGFVGHGTVVVIDSGALSCHSSIGSCCSSHHCRDRPTSAVAPLDACMV
jgi:hypothetical protein